MVRLSIIARWVVGFGSCFRCEILHRVTADNVFTHSARHVRYGSTLPKPGCPLFEGVLTRSEHSTVARSSASEKLLVLSLDSGGAGLGLASPSMLNSRRLEQHQLPNARPTYNAYPR